MILYIQIILIIVLLLILSSLYLEERKKKKVRVPTGKLTQIWDGTERRRFVRTPRNIPVRYNLPKEPNDSKNAKTKDISIGGICISINEKLNPKTRLCLEIESTDSPKPIFAEGEVVWVKEDREHKNKEEVRYFNVGIEFKGILPKDRERLFEFIRGLEPN